MKTDYQLVQENDFDGLIKKHNGYINHFARSLYYSEFEDSKQELLIEVMKLWNWVDKKRIDENFKMRYFMFQKFNAYRKNKKSRNKKEQLKNENDTTTMVMSLSTKENLEMTYFMRVEFPETLTSKEKVIYERALLASDKMINICADLKITYNEYNKIKKVVEQKFKSYMTN